ncbi:MAG: peptidoglycan-binding domain-containing protein, partial [Verrucomicrobiota bacterium]
MKRLALFATVFGVCAFFWIEAAQAGPCYRGGSYGRSGVSFYFGNSYPSYGYTTYRPVKRYYRSYPVDRYTVRKVQVRLNKYGYRCGAVDGVLGYQTRSALK